MPSNREQVIKQCEVVAHLAKSIANVHADYAAILRDGGLEVIVNDVGNSTAYLMEVLGDILNNMDATDEEADAWTNPVFAQAHRIWPQPDASA